MSDEILNLEINTKTLGDGAADRLLQKLESMVAAMNQLNEATKKYNLMGADGPIAGSGAKVIQSGIRVTAAGGLEGQIATAEIKGRVADMKAEQSGIIAITKARADMDRELITYSKNLEYQLAQQNKVYASTKEGMVIERKSLDINLAKAQLARQILGNDASKKDISSANKAIALAEKELAILDKKEQKNIELLATMKDQEAFGERLTALSRGTILAQNLESLPSITLNEASLKRQAVLKKEIAELTALILSEEAEYGQLNQNQVNKLNLLKQELTSVVQIEKERLSLEREQAAAIAKANKASLTPTIAPAAPMTLAQQGEAARVYGMERLFGDFGASLFKTQAALLVNYTLMNQLFNLFSFGTKFVVDLDKAFFDLQAITVTTNTEMKGLFQTIIDVSKGTRFSAVEVANAAKVLGQAGFSAQQIKESIKAVTLLATASGTSLSESVDVASSVISVFNLRAEDMGHVADVATGALNMTKLTMDKLALGIQYAGNVAAEAGMSFEETTAVLGAMSNAGLRSGSTLGSGLRAVIVAMLNPTAKLVAGLHAVGLTVQDVDIKSKGFVGVMKTLRDAGFNASDAFESMNIRGAAAFAAIEKSPDVINAIAQSFTFSSAAAQANATQMEGLSAKANQLSSVFGTLIVNAFGPLTGALKVSIDLLRVFLDLLGQVPLLLPMLATAGVAWTVQWSAPRLTGLITGLMGVKKALVEVGSQAEFFGAETAAAAVATETFGVAVKGFMMTNIVGIALTAVIGVFAAYDHYINQATDDIDKHQAALDSAKGSFDKTGEGITSITENLTKLTEKYANLKGKPEEIFTEMVGLQGQFGELGLKIHNETNPSIDDLIDGLKRLRGELQKTSTEQISQMLSERAMLFQAQAAKARADNSGSKYTSNAAFKNQFLRGATSSQSTLLGQTADLGARIGTSFEQASTLGDMANVPQAEIVRQKSQLATLLSDVKNQMGQYSSAIAQMEADKVKGLAVNQQMLNAFKDRHNLLQKDAGNIGTLAAQLSFFVIDRKTQLQEEIKNTDTYKVHQDAIIEFQKTLANDQKAFNDAKGAPAKEAAKAQLDKDIAAFNKMMIDYTVTNFKELLAEVQKAMGKKVPDAEVASAAAAQIKQDAKDALSLADAKSVHDGESLIASAAAAIAVFQAALQKMKDIYAHVTDAFDNDIKKLDAMSRENADIHSKGFGKYTDAELSMMKDTQATDKASALKAQMDSLPAVIAKLDAVIGKQSATLNNTTKDFGLQGSDENKTKMAAAQAALNTSTNERIGYDNQLIQITDEYNALMGTRTDTEKTYMEQLQYSIEQYTKNAAYASDWANTVQADVNHTLDDSKNAFKGFVTSIATGTASIGSSFRTMMQAILKSMLDTAAGKVGDAFAGIAGSLLGAGLSAVFGGGQAVGGASSNMQVPGSMGASQNMQLPPKFNLGGIIGANAGTYIGRDNQLVLAQQGEGVLRRSAMDLIGSDNLAQINAMGNRRTSQSVPVMPKPVPPMTTNVYVVAPDQKPSLTKGDILVTITDDMRNGGATKKLIKSIVAGTT